MSHVSHNVSYHTYECAVSHVLMSHDVERKKVHMVGHTWMSHVTWICHVTLLDVSCRRKKVTMHKIEHTWMSHVTHMNVLCHTYERVMSQNERDNAQNRAHVGALPLGYEQESLHLFEFAHLTRASTPGIHTYIHGVCVCERESTRERESKTKRCS